MMTHEARERDIYEAFKEIDGLDVISSPSIFIRVEDTAIKKGGRKDEWR
jgi:hypothetical protein